MRKQARIAATVALAAGSLLWTLPAFSADAPAVVRKMLMQQDAPGGQTLSLVAVTIPVGGREGRHSHPGPLIAHVESGALVLDYEGKPTVTYKAGDTFFVEAGKIHEGINQGTAPVVLTAAFVTPKGGPLTDPAK